MQEYRFIQVDVFTAALNRVCRDLGAECVMVFTLETERTKATVHVRMFAPLLGVAEDPATYPSPSCPLTSTGGVLS